MAALPFTMKILFVTSILFFFSQTGIAQDCKSNIASQAMDETISYYVQNDFEVASSFQVMLHSDQEYKSILSLKSNYSYVLIMCTPSGIQASAIELRDDNGIQIGYEQKVNEPDNNIVSLEYDGGYGGNFISLFKVIDDAHSTTCAYITILQKEN